MSDKPLSTRDLVDSDEQDTRKQNENLGQDNGPQGSTDQEMTRPGTDRDLTDDGSGAGDYGTDEDGYEPLFPADQAGRFTERWQEIQATFVDEPRQSVEDADTLVADLMQRLAGSFANERERLEAQWDKGDDVSTEDLRVALTRYRSFFERLLAA
jgi:hypothetical protein